MIRRQVVSVLALVTMTLTTLAWVAAPSAADTGTAVPAGDTYQVTQDLALNVGAPGVLGNDETGGGPAAAVSVDDPLHSLDFRLNEDGSFFYEPMVGYAGTDTFTYRIRQSTEGGNVFSAPATVTIDVVPRIATTLKLEPLLIHLGGPGLLKVALGTLTAHLTGPDGIGIAGQSILFDGATSHLCSAVTDNTGTGTCSMGLMTLLGKVLGGHTDVLYAGSSAYLPTQVSGNLLIGLG
jgi:hypothetical protein